MGAILVGSNFLYTCLFTNLQMEGINTKQKLSIIFLVVLCFIVTTGVWYGLRFDSHKEKIPFTPAQLRKIEACQDASGDLVNVADTNIVCYSNSERKRDILLLSTYPVTGAPLLRTIYEEATKISTYTQYREQGSFTNACNFQTGPWMLFCDKHEEKIACKHKSPPPLDVPYFVNSNYPIYSDMCDGLGYPLPRHEKVIHIVRNPVDNIEAWMHYDFGAMTTEAWTLPTVTKYIEEYQSWHDYWKDYHFNEPSIPTLWIRYEDFCYCTKPAVDRILEFSQVSPHLNLDDLLDILQKNPCSEVKQVGKGVSHFSTTQLEYIQNNFDYVLRQFGYDELMNKFIEHAKNPDSKSALQDFHQALWSDIEFGSHPSDAYCAELLAIEWDWGNDL